MKLNPIYNPHSKIGQVLKKTKQEEKEEFLSKTKTSVIEKYGKKSGNRFNQHKLNMTGTGTNNFAQKDDFKLEEKVTAKSESIKLMQKGYVQAYVDFFYITTETTPSEIEPSKQLQEDYKLNKKRKQKFEHTESKLKALSEDLQDAEEHHRNGQTEKCLEKYRKVAKDFEKKDDYETASYFYKKCLDVSEQDGLIKGEAEAYQGLGTCEENVLNIFNAMGNLETALEKSTEGHLDDLLKQISKDLVRVYQIIAVQFQDQNDFDKSLNYFEKCLSASQRAADKDMEGECYQKIGKIEEKLGNLDKAIEYLQKFLSLCEETKNTSKQSEAHRQLAEAYSKNGKVVEAIEHLTRLLVIASEDKNKVDQANAFLKLGLLYYQEGNVRRSVEHLQKHFELARAGEEQDKNQKLIDKARVNLGIAQANTSLENYKYLVLNDLNGLLDWKIRRQMKR